MSAYAYIEKDEVIIGNDYIERRFSTKDKTLITIDIVNKRIKNQKKIVFKDSSAEFIVSFRFKKFLGYKTEFLSSNSLELESVNVLNKRVEFTFCPYSYNGAKIRFVECIEIEDDNPYMHKYIEMMVAPEEQHLLMLDYIDCEHILIDTPEQSWTIGEIDEAYLSKYHSALGQPVYVNGLFMGSEFPLAENTLENNAVYLRYFSGKRFDELSLSCGHTFRTWKTVMGSARGLEQEVIREDFLSYIRDISRKIEPRFQYNSWYDHMHDITNENIMASFKEIEDNLSKTMVPPLHSYVVDDGFADWDADFWAFNSKFPEELYPASSIARKFSSEFGLWNGPRGGYNNKTPFFGHKMEKAGKGGYNRAAADVCVSSIEYIKNITDYYLDYTKKFDINYWKLDGFLLKACPSNKHGHMTGGYNDMYQYTEMWENWIDIFKKLRIARESIGKDMWINQTSYCNASPWFLQWSDSLWIQNSGDIGFVDKTDNGEKLSTRDVDRVLTYRDGRYYDFSVERNYQFPHEFIYNHDPIYGNTAKISMTDDEFRKYMFMMTTRGTAFWELYYSYNMFSKAKWRINSDALRFIRNNYDILKTSRFIGGSPTKGEVYGYSAWTENAGIVSLRNPSQRPRKFTINLDKTIGVFESTKNLRRVSIYPYEASKTDKLYNYGDCIYCELDPCEVVVFKFTAQEERVPEFVYGKFLNKNNLLLHFDERIYNYHIISSEEEISDVEILDDYSTLKIKFENSVERATVSLRVENALGDYTDVNFSGENDFNLITEDKQLSRLRDISVQFVLKDTASEKLITIDKLFSLSVVDGFAKIYFGDSENRGDTELRTGDVLTIVFEPNALSKIYINGELSCSAYNEFLAYDTNPYEVTVGDNVADFKVISKALSFNEV